MVRGRAVLPADIYAFSPTDGSVKRLGRLPGPVSEASAFAINGMVYVVGGVGPGGTAVTSATAIDPATGRVTPQHPLASAASDMSVAQGTDNAILVGGQSNSQTLDQVLVASVRTVSLVPIAVVHNLADAFARHYRPMPRPGRSPGLLLIADRGNNRLLVMNAQKKIVWHYPAPNLPAPAYPLYFPDDAFWVHGGNAIVVNEEENNTVIEIAYPSGKWIWSYGHPKVSGSGPGYLFQPDDLYPYPGGGVVVADAKNCRILFIDANGFLRARLDGREIARPAFRRPSLSQRRHAAARWEPTDP